MILKINGVDKYFDNPIKLEELTNDFNFYAAKVNNTIRDLNYIVKEDSIVELLTLKDPDAVRIYEATLRYITVMAIKNLYKNAKVRMNYSISMGIFVDISNLNIRIDEEVTNKITLEMQKIIDSNYKINRLKIKKDEAFEIYNKMGLKDKDDILNYRTDEYVNLYECNGFYDYMFQHMTPSTGYIKEFKLFPYFPQMILQYPRSETNGLIPKFNYSKKYAKTLTMAKKWSLMQGVSNISDLNEKLKNTSPIDFINVCEAKHNKMICEIGDIIEDPATDIKLIGIAGPSSSGKTTFANKVRIELIARGFNPIMISLDDYYINYADIIPNEEGIKDLEAISALDVARFNNDMLNLILGLKVEIPKYNFKTQKREKGRKLKLPDKGIIIIEGIHALADELTSQIPREQKFKIFISPQQQINIDDSNPIRITDIRLIRRAVRDNLFRNYNVEMTLDIWPNVRKGEFKWIYDYQEDADYIFNSEIAYELCVLKKYAYPLFKNVKRESPNFNSANRIVKFLKYFKEIDDTYIPCNSLLREFIGGSCFK